MSHQVEEGYHIGKIGIGFKLISGFCVSKRILKNAAQVIWGKCYFHLKLHREIFVELNNLSIL